MQWKRFTSITLTSASSGEVSCESSYDNTTRHHGRQYKWSGGSHWSWWTYKENFSEYSLSEDGRHSQQVSSVTLLEMIGKYYYGTTSMDGRRFVMFLVTWYRKSVKNLHTSKIMVVVVVAESVDTDGLMVINCKWKRRRSGWRLNPRRNQTMAAVYAQHACGKIDNRSFSLLSKDWYHNRFAMNYHW